MNIFLPLIYTALLFLIIRQSKFFQLAGFQKSIFPTLFLLKVFAAVALGIVYTYYYKPFDESDTYLFFADGTTMAGSLSNSFSDFIKLLFGVGEVNSDLAEYYAKMSLWSKDFNYEMYNDNRPLIKLNAIFSLFAFGYYYVHSVFFAFLSFCGSFLIFKTLYCRFSGKKILLIISVFLLPSVVFWSSGVIKESYIIFILGLFVYAFFKLLDGEFSVKNIVLLLIAASLLLTVKLYVVLCIVPAAAAAIVVKKSMKFVAFKLASVLILFTVSIVVFSIVSNYDLFYIISKKQNDFINMALSSGKAGSLYDIPVLSPDFISVLRNAPLALFNSLTRPFFTDSGSFVLNFAATENVLVVLFMIFCFVFGSIKKSLSEPLIVFSLVFAVLFLIICGLTTPVLGSLVRYKAPAMPFLMIFFTHIFDEGKFMSFINKLKTGTEK